MNNEKNRLEAQDAPSSEAKAPALDTLDDAALFARVEQGDEAAEQELASRHLPLVKTVARNYRTPGADFDDLVQEGSVGLVRAIRKFDPARGFQFSTYAHWWIRQAISRFVKGPTRLIRLPEYVHDEISRLHRMREQTQLETGASPTEKELEASLEWKEGRVRWLDRLSSDAGSLDSRLREGAGLSVESTVASARTPDPEAVASSRAAWDQVQQSWEKLPSREARILDYRYGLSDGHRRSLSWIGKEIGLSPERVRQLEKRAIETLRAEAA